MSDEQIPEHLTGKKLHKNKLKLLLPDQLQQYRAIRAAQAAQNAADAAALHKDRLNDPAYRQELVAKEAVSKDRRKERVARKEAHRRFLNRVLNPKTFISS